MTDRPSVGRARRPFLILGIALAMALPAACDTQPVPRPNLGDVGCPVGGGGLGLVYGARANVPEPTLPEQLTNMVQTFAMDEKPIAVARVDGEPVVTPIAAFVKPRDSNPGYVNQELAAWINGFYRTLAGIHAVTDEADPLTALTEVARATPAGGTVVFFDSGLQTVAPLNFTDGTLLDAEPADVVQFLGRQLPDLTKRNVVLVGIGNTAEPQPALDTGRRRNVTEIWKAIAAKGGASCVTEIEWPVTTRESLPAMPKVTVVKLPPPLVFQDCGQTVLRNTGKVRFKPDSAELVNRNEARTVLSELADKMIRGRQRATLTGTTATDGPVPGRLELSRRRAEAIKAELVALGVPADRIATKGVGTAWSGHVQDIGPDGRLLPGPAAQNRAVVIELLCPR